MLLALLLVVAMVNISAIWLQNSFNARFFLVVSDNSGLDIFLHKLSVEMKENTWIVQGDKEE